MVHLGVRLCYTKRAISQLVDLQNRNFGELKSATVQTHVPMLVTSAQACEGGRFHLRVFILLTPVALIRASSSSCFADFSSARLPRSRLVRHGKEPADKCRSGDCKAGD